LHNIHLHMHFLHLLPLPLVPTPPHTGTCSTLLFSDVKEKK
jgi:hypothetical protein